MLAHHVIGKEEGDLGENGQDKQTDQHSNPEGPDPPEDGVHGHIL